METLEVFYILKFLDPHVSGSDRFAGSGINFFKSVSRYPLGLESYSHHTHGHNHNTQSTI